MRDGAGFSVAVGEYILGCTPDGISSLFKDLQRQAQLVERFDINGRGPDGSGLCCVTVSRSDESWPFLVVAQDFHPSSGGFEPGLLLNPSTNLLFIGAGERLLAYDLVTPRRLWEDATNGGFWCWAQHGNVVLMLAELELAAWNTHGEKLWTTFVEPPWDYTVEADTVRLDVMGLSAVSRSSRGPAEIGFTARWYGAILSS
jgi:hypothetical protein